MHEICLWRVGWICEAILDSLLPDTGCTKPLPDGVVGATALTGCPFAAVQFWAAVPSQV
jgi:hypothetical protein